MTSKLVMLAVTIGVLALAIGLVLPPLISAPGEDTDHRATLEEGETTESGDALLVTLDEIDQGNDSATITLTDDSTNETNTTVVAEGENATVMVSDEEVVVTLESIVDASTADVTVSYSPMFGWSDGAKTLAENLDVLMALLAFLMAVGLVIRVMP